MKINFILMKGVVIKSTGSLCQVLSHNKKQYSCKVKGKTRLLNLDFTNPITVGDVVEFTFDIQNNIGVIERIYDRKNYIIRKAVNLSHKSQVIASNIDLALLIVTIQHPITSLNFIDRFLIQAEAYGIESKLVFNKIDLHDKKTHEKKLKYQKIYEDIGYQTVSTSIYNPDKTLEIKQLLKNKVTVLTGHSGVGKSSLINIIDNKLQLKTKNISDYHNQGVHTTTYTEMFPLDFGGYIIDTPGIKGLGLIDVDMNLLGGYFPEMTYHSDNCKFKNCMHIKEPDCAVLDAIENQLIAKSRYKSYLSMLEENTNYRRNNY